MAVSEETEDRFDLVIVGGGIIGLAAARDAALRGLRVALVEKEDYGWGTSNRATRLAHGGLRYLEQYDFGLVREDLRERERLFKNAPHLVRPLPFIIPMYHASLSYRVKMRAGMLLYDALSYDKSLPLHRHLSSRQVRELEPGLTSRGLAGGFLYYDGQITFTERLNVENAVAAREAGAAMHNHMRAVDLLRQGRAVTGVVAQDTITGERREFPARLVLNAAGPWLDEIGALLGAHTRLSRRTKGVHLVMPRVGDHAVVLFAQTDQRLFFVVPWNGYSLLGTTDTDFTGDLDHIATEPEDARYLLTEVRHAYPAVEWQPIYFTWAGVRSLMHIEGIPESDVTRRHVLYDHARDGTPGMLSIIGGKLTAYRAIAEDLIDAACRLIGVRAASITANLPLPGGMVGSDFNRYRTVHAAGWAKQTGLDATIVKHLIEVYGARHNAVLTLLQQDPALGMRISEERPEILAQVAYAVLYEGAQTLADVMLRRLTVGLSAARGRDAVDAVTAWLTAQLGWDAARARAERDAWEAQVSLGDPPPLEPITSHATVGEVLHGLHS